VHAYETNNAICINITNVIQYISAAFVKAWCELSEDGTVAPIHVGVLINSTIVNTVRV
jgi:hypothetical protein